MKKIIITCEDTKVATILAVVAGEVVDLKLETIEEERTHAPKPKAEKKRTRPEKGERAVDILYNAFPNHAWFTYKDAKITLNKGGFQGGSASTYLNRLKSAKAINAVVIPGKPYKMYRYQFLGPIPEDFKS